MYYLHPDKLVSVQKALRSRNQSEAARRVRKKTPRTQPQQYSLVAGLQRRDDVMKRIRRGMGS